MQSGLKVICEAGPERGEAARKKLIDAALRIFSEVGFTSATTRALASKAGVNVSAIPYYFGSKEGLYLAIIEQVIAYYQQNLGITLQSIQQTLDGQSASVIECRALLEEYMRALIRFVLQETEEKAQMARIYIREQLDPTSAYDRLYQRFTRGTRQILEELVAVISHKKAGSVEVRLLAETIIGMVTTFKSSRAAVLHNMGWSTFGEDGMAEIERLILFNANALMTAYAAADKS